MAPVTRSGLNRSEDEKSSSTRRGKKVLPVAQSSNTGRGRKRSVAKESSSVGQDWYFARKKCYSADMEKHRRCYSADMEKKHNYWCPETSPVWVKFKTTAKEIHKSDPDMCRPFRKMFDQFHSYKKWSNVDSFLKAVSERFQNIHNLWRHYLSC